jgi:hypothetical protein
MFQLTAAKDLVNSFINLKCSCLGMSEKEEIFGLPMCAYSFLLPPLVIITFRVSLLLNHLLCGHVLLCG